jgi:hypothetical protein
MVVMLGRYLDYGKSLSVRGRAGPLVGLLSFGLRVLAASRGFHEVLTAVRACRIFAYTRSLR